MIKQNLSLLIILLLCLNNIIESKDECYEFDEYKYMLCSNIKLADENKHCSFINNESKSNPKNAHYIQEKMQKNANLLFPDHYIHIHLIKNVFLRMENVKKNLKLVLIIKRGNLVISAII